MQQKGQFSRVSLEADKEKEKKVLNCFSVLQCVNHHYSRQD